MRRNIEHKGDPDDMVRAGEDMPEISSEIVAIKPSSAMDRLRSLSATSRLEEMEKNITMDRYIIPEMALDGQITLFYAKPNTGKTLFFLKFIIDGISNGTIQAKDVFYVNADDSYKGLFAKAKIAKQHGFNMISPAEAGINPADVIRLLDQLSESEEVRGKIIFIDTLKKFADMMNKKSQAHFFHVLRKLGTRDVTVIIASHANKHLNTDGEMIYEGTSDTMNDIDCAYSMHRISDAADPKQVVEFRREKDRGSVVPRVVYRYRKTNSESYIDIVNSIERVDDGVAQELSLAAKHDEIREKYEPVLLFVTDLLSAGKLIQTDIIKAYTGGDHIKEEVTKSGFTKGLRNLTGIAWSTARDRSNNNALVYELIGSANDYRRAKGGRG